MSVDTQLQFMREKIAESYDVLESKGGTLPQIKSFENLPQTILSNYDSLPNGVARYKITNGNTIEPIDYYLGGLLPDNEYTQVEYVENSADTLVQTAINIGNNDNFKMDITATVVAGSFYLFQARDAVAANHGNATICGISGSQNGGTIIGGSGGSTALTSDITRPNRNGHKLNIVFDCTDGNMSLYVKDLDSNVSDTKTGTYDPTALTRPITNICIYGNEAPAISVALPKNRLAAGCKVYGAKLWKNGVLVLDLIPVKRFNGEVGFINKVNTNFISASSGSLTAGNKTGLPEQYMELRYITTTGTQYIETNVTGAARWVGAGQGTSDASGSKCILGGLSTSGASVYLASRFGSASSSSAKSWTIDGSGNASGISGLTYVDYDITYNSIPEGGSSSSFTGTINGVSVTRTNSDDFTTWYIGAAFGAPTPTVYGFVGNIYEQKAYQNGVLVADYVPAKRKSDGVVGMYDTVSDTFLTNSGEGTIVAGPFVGTNSGYVELEYLQSTGTQYINTNIIPTNDLGFKTQISVPDVTSDYAKIGCRQDSGNTRYWWGVTSGKAYMGWDGIYPTSSSDRPNVSINTFYDLEVNYFNDRCFKQDDVIYYNNLPTLNTTFTRNFILFGTEGQGGISTANKASSIKQMIFTRGDGIIMYLIPAKRVSDDTLGMYDIVSDTFLTNSGTGTFTAGPLRQIHSGLFDDIITINNHGLFMYYFQHINISGKLSFPNFTTTNKTDCLRESFSSSYKIVKIDLSNFTNISWSWFFGGAFSACKSIIDVDLSNLTTIDNQYCCANMFRGCTSLKSVDFSSLTSIDAYGCCKDMFSDCTALKNVDFPSLTTMSSSMCCQYMFYGCTALESASFPSLTTINGYQCCNEMFRGCTSLESISFPSLTSIYSSNSCANMFRGCTALESISFPSLTTISYNDAFSNIFNGCTALTEIHFRSDMQSRVENLDTYSSQFGATNATIYFDL